MSMTSTWCHQDNPLVYCRWSQSKKEAQPKFDDISAADSQDKTKNTYKWVGMFPSGWNDDKKLVNFWNVITLESDNNWMDWVFKTVCKLSGRPLDSIKIIPCDLRPSSENIKNYTPGECPQLSEQQRWSIFSHITFVCISTPELNKTQFVKDHYHLKYSVWPTMIGEHMYQKHWTHLEWALACTTKEKYDHHVSAV